MREPRVITAPREGYWAIRLTSGGPEVAACIRLEQSLWEPGEPTNLLDRSPILTARINGEIVPLDDVWLRRGREIDEATYAWLLADRRWAKTYAGHLPEARPRQAVDLRALKPVTP